MKTFSFVVCHTGDSPLGPSVPRDHAAFSMLSVQASGPRLDDLAVGEGGHVRRAVTADGRREHNGKIVNTYYSVTRLT